MSDEKNGAMNGADLSEEDLEALFAAEVAKEKEKQQADIPADGEPDEDELAAMFAAEVAKETAVKAGAAAVAPPPRAKAPPVAVKPAQLPAFDNIPGQRGDEPAKDVNLEMILDIPVDVHVEVGHTRVRVQEILRLDIGSVVELNRVAGHPADIIVNGKLIGQGDVVVVNENFGIRVTRLVGLEERLNSL